LARRAQSTQPWTSLSLVLLQPPPEATESELAAQLVGVLFAAAAPLTSSDAARVLDVSPDRLEQVCGYLDEYPPLGLALQRHADEIQLTTSPAVSAAVERYLGAPPPVRLSRAALEALAVVAYRQPVTRSEIDFVRGVNSDSAVATLVGRGLVAEVGRKESVGRPALLATTAECLQYLGLRSLADLPPLEPRA
jgi:segregation and condensation protein B